MIYFISLASTACINQQHKTLTFKIDRLTGTRAAAVDDAEEPVRAADARPLRDLNEGMTVLDRNSSTLLLRPLYQVALLARLGRRDVE